jgi:hypothetical protein
MQLLRAQAQIGFVLHNRLRQGAGGARGPAGPASPAGQIGFVLHDCQRPCGPRSVRPTGNWVRFARLPASLRPSVRLAHRELGSFCTFHSPAEPRPTRQSLLPTHPNPPKFGFVSHNFLRHPPPAGPNWVRFARFTPRAGSRPTRPQPYPYTPGHLSLALFDAYDKSRGSGFRSAFLALYRGLVRLNSTFVVGVLFCAFTTKPGQIGFVLHATRPRGGGRGV